MDLLLGMIILFLILTKVKKWGVKLFWLYAACMTIFAFWGYMAMDGFRGGGDFSNLARLIGVSRYLAGIIGLLGLIGFAYLISRHIFKTFSIYFPLDFFWKKFAVFMLFIGLPGIIYAGIGYLLSPIGNLDKFLITCVLAIIISAMLSLFHQESRTFFVSLPRWYSVAGILILTIAVIIWLGIFGSSEPKAKGLLWTTPQEESVSACNILMFLKKDASAWIDFLMRPTTRSIFWEKMKGQPPNWLIYEKFIETNLPVLLGISEYNILEQNDDATVPFFVRVNDQGARKISIGVNLTPKFQNVEGNKFALEITDFWRIKGGFIEKLQAHLEDGMSFSDYELIPENAKKPDGYDEHEIAWENRDARAPEKMRLIFSCLNKGGK